MEQIGNKALRAISNTLKKWKNDAEINENHDVAFKYWNMEKNYRKNIMDIIGATKSEGNESKTEEILIEDIKYRDYIKNLLLGLEEYYKTKKQYLETQDKKKEENLLLDLEDIIHSNLLVNTRSWLVSSKYVKFPLLNTIDEEEYIQMTRLFSRTPFWISWEFSQWNTDDIDEVTWIQNCYPDKIWENKETEENKEWIQVKLLSGSTSNDQEGFVSYLNEIRERAINDDKITETELKDKIRNNIDKFISIFKGKEKIFITVFSNHYHQEEIEELTRKHFPIAYEKKNLSQFIETRYSCDYKFWFRL